MRKITLFLTLLICLYGPIAHGNGISHHLAIPGTGDSQTLLRILAHEFELNNPDTPIEIPGSIGSSGGIKMLQTGKTPLARIARPLTKEEQDGTLTTLTFAMSPIVFVVNPQISNLTNITTEEILGIYSGKINQWKDLNVSLDKIFPITREQTDSSLLVLNRHIQNFATINSLTAKIIYSTPDTVETLRRYKRTIGFIPIADAINAKLHILTIDGISASPENVQSGLYKFVTPLNFIYKEKEGPSDVGQAFIDFVFSPDGERIIHENGLIPGVQPVE